MRVFNVALTANVTRELDIEGRFFMLVTTAAPLRVDLSKGGRDLNESGENVEGGYKAEPPDGFDQVLLTSAATQTVTIGIARGRGSYDRWTGLGNITARDDLLASALDPLTARTWSFASTVAAVAAQYSFMALGNPANSGKTVVVTRIVASRASAGLLVLAGNANATLGGSLLAAARYIGAAARAAQTALPGMWGSSQASVWGDATLGQVQAVSANGPVELYTIKNSAPIILPASTQPNAVAVYPATQNVALDAQFEWVEVP